MVILRLYMGFVLGVSQGYITGYMGDIWGLYGDNGKENGNHYLRCRVIRGTCLRVPRVRTLSMLGNKPLSATLSLRKRNRTLHIPAPKIPS